MHALIDSDILCYEMGSATDDEGHPLKWPLVRARVDSRIEQILEATEAESWQGFLTGRDNFRERVATIKPYKGERKRSERPFWYAGVFDYLRDVKRAAVIHGMEADDAIAIEHHNSSGTTVICSRDKDLRMVPGWHYVWPAWTQPEQKPFYVTELDGLRAFYSQLLTGDRVDNILGLYGVGVKSACVQRLKEYGTELEMFAEVKAQYEMRFGSYWDMFMCENGRLLWMLRSKDDDWYGRQKALDNSLLSL